MQNVPKRVIKTTNTAKSDYKHTLLDHDVVITVNTCHLDITCMIEQTKINKTNSGDFPVVK